MSMVSHLHQLFNPETCQSYIHNVALERSAPPMSAVSEPQRRSVGLPTICQPQFVKFLPQLYDRLTMNPARIVADTITEHGHQDAQQTVPNSAQAWPCRCPLARRAAYTWLKCASRCIATRAM